MLASHRTLGDVKDSKDSKESKSNVSKQSMFPLSKERKCYVDSRVSYIKELELGSTIAFLEQKKLPLLNLLFASVRL